MTRFATSDEHFYHNNILTGWDGTQRPRPFATMEDMVEGMIDRHNAVVRDNDEVYHLGDMFWKSAGIDRAIWIRQRLRGKHFYALGNHDEMFWLNKEQTLPSQLQNHFESVKQRYWMPSNGINRHGLVLEHYAGRVWQGSHKGSYQLFGHSHGGLNHGKGQEDYLSYDVGVDVNDFTPVAFEDIAVILRKRAERREFRIKNAPKRVRDYYSITT